MSFLTSILTSSNSKPYVILSPYMAFRVIRLFLCVFSSYELAASNYMSGIRRQVFLCINFMIVMYIIWFDPVICGLIKITIFVFIVLCCCIIIYRSIFLVIAVSSIYFIIDFYVLIFERIWIEYGLA